MAAGTYLFEFTNLQPGVPPAPCGWGSSLSVCIYYSLQSTGGAVQLAVFDDLDAPPLRETFPFDLLTGPFGAQGVSAALTLGDREGYIRMTLMEDVVFNFLAVSFVLTFNNPAQPGTQINHLFQVITLGSPPEPIPEPATGVLLMIGLGAICRGRSLSRALPQCPQSTSTVRVPAH